MQLSNKATLLAPVFLGMALLAALFFGIAPAARAGGPWYVNAASGDDGNGF